MSLPTYEEAVNGPEILPLVARYLNGNDLAKCCRVSKEFSSLATPILWQRPLQYIAANGKPCAAFHKFFREAKYMRPELRELVTVMDFAILREMRLNQSHTVDYQKYESILTIDWLLTQLRLFPNVICIHLDDSSAKGGDSDLQFGDQWLGDLGSINPSVLSLSGCQSFSSAKLVNADLTTNLLYLDISGTIPMDGWLRRFTFENLPNIRILKLRSLRLTDHLLPSVIYDSNYQLWSLDLRDNLLTDITIEFLLLKCILPRTSLVSHEFCDRNYENSPAYREYPEDDVGAFEDRLVPLRPDTIETLTSYLAVHSFLEPTAPQRARPIGYSTPLLARTGITHLYLSENKLSSRAALRLLTATDRLQVVDLGSVRRHLIMIPGAEVYMQPNILPYLRREYSPQLYKLRVHHSVVTGAPTIISAFANGNCSLVYKDLVAASPVDADSFHTISSRIHTLTLTSLPRVCHSEVFLKVSLLLVALRKQEMFLEGLKAGRGGRRAPEVLSGVRHLRLEFLKRVAEGEKRKGERKKDFSFFPEEGGVGEGDGERRVEWVAGEVDLVEELKRLRGRQRVEERWGGRLEVVLKV